VLGDEMILLYKKLDALQRSLGSICLGIVLPIIYLDLMSYQVFRCALYAPIRRLYQLQFL